MIPETSSSTSSTYGLISRINHWVVAAAFLVALGIGLVIDYGNLPEERVFTLYDWHMFFGMIVLVYGAWRVGWRMVHGFSDNLAPMPRWQNVLSKAVHIGLLAAIVLLPLSGVLMMISDGLAVAIWNVTLIPSIGEISWLNRGAGAVHGLSPYALVPLLVLHIGAALRHHFVKKNATLTA
ncbi:MAG: cytochrome b/b6 domain-containing protein [Hyphomicrobiales bacterium]|jgi:cytochrome b561